MSAVNAHGLAKVPPNGYALLLILLGKKLTLEFWFSNDLKGIYRIFGSDGLSNCISAISSGV